MNTGSQGTLRSAALAALLLLQVTAHAIEKPKQAPPPEAPPAPPPVTIAPTDETQFQQVLQRVSAFRSLRGLGVSDQVIEQLSRGEADQAVAALNTLAVQGNKQADIALVRVQHWCNTVTSARPTDWQAQLPQVGKQFPSDRAPRVAGLLKAEAEFGPKAKAGCQRARFDFGGIESRLRAAANSGDPASATELAQFARDPAKREALLQSAMSKNYPQAMYAAASNLLAAVQRGETTENVGKIREYLKVAGRAIPKAKLDLANCMAVGCDGHPADTRTALAFGTDAARDGEPTAFLSMARMPWGRQMPRVQMLAWQYFGDQLNEAGCLGDAYIATSLGFAQTIPMLERGQPPQVLEAAKTQAETLWNDNGARAKKENGCP
ncbi:hypothetical protein [Steroidobacter sp.]|uniref:hypothetical protein n=1 Tax=Steroidobacter sp. TaxID=1978227 RepID=UPI001A4C8CDA|nr:hypothetical protein [Steroidobacter sp.]MBL8271845.1 hypothetical protein [Steroidobacter sp.]